MPKKLKEIRKILRNANFISLPAKGSHEKWTHPLLIRPIILAGRDSDDAKAYLEKQVKQALEEIELKEREE